MRLAIYDTNIKIIKKNVFNLQNRKIKGKNRQFINSPFALKNVKLTIIVKSGNSAYID